MVAKALGGAELVPIKTSGDEGSAGAASDDKARFVREIETALIEGDVDLAVHSAKDLPSELPDGLEIAGVPERADPLDAWIGAAGSLDAVPEGARVGTSSLRRRAQLLALRPDLETLDLRGNVDTRLRRLAEGDFDGLLLAAAGLQRLGRGDEIAFTLDPAVMTPAPGQGCLVLEGRADHAGAVTAAETITDRQALAELGAERAAVAALEASCNTPLGVRAAVASGQMTIDGFCGLPDGSEWIRDRVEGDASDPEALGGSLAERMSAAGAGELLKRAEQMAVSS
jgi:hydroxymethylbilane synthase